MGITATTFKPKSIKNHALVPNLLHSNGQTDTHIML